MNAFATGADPYAQAVPADLPPRLDRRVPGATLAGRPVAVPQATPDPAALAVLGHVAGSLRRPGGPALPPEPLYADAARQHRAATRPQPPFTPAGAALPVRDALPGDGRLAGLLARMAANSAERTEPIFRDTCADCKAAAGWCRHHQAMREESREFRRLALALGGAATDRDAVLLVASVASAAGLRVQSPSSWPGRRDRSVTLLTRAEGAALPDSEGCCAPERLCADHDEDLNAATLVGDIRDAMVDARSPAEAAQLIVAALTMEAGR